MRNKVARHLQAEKIYYEQFYSERHGKLRKWLIVKLIKFQLRFKK